MENKIKGRCGWMLVFFCMGLILCMETQSLAASTASPEPKKTTKSSTLRLAAIDVSGLGCLGCLRHLEKSLQLTPGIVRAYAAVNADTTGATVRVIYETAVAKLPDVLHAIERDTHDYKVRSDVPTSGPPYAIHANDPIAKEEMPKAQAKSKLKRKSS